MEKQAQLALVRQLPHIKGVKGKSIISSLPLVDLATCVMPEHMHSVLLGADKQFLNLWLN